MADSLNGIAELARDLAFRQRVQAAMAVCARDVGAEAGSLDSDYSMRRWDAAKDMMTSWNDEYLDGMAWLVAANPVIRRGSSDDDIQFTVNSVFPVVAASGPPSQGVAQ